MLESINTSSDPKVADSPDAALQMEDTLKARLGITSTDVGSSQSLRVVQAVANSMKEATEAIQANSELLSDVVTKDQRTLFSSFLTQLREDTADGEDVFLKNMDKTLDKLAALQVSFTTALSQKPGDENLKKLLDTIVQIKNMMPTPEKKETGLWAMTKAQLFTMPKKEHFRKDSFVQQLFATPSADQIYDKKLAHAAKMEKINSALATVEAPLGLEFDSTKGKHITPKVDTVKKPAGKNFRDTPLAAPKTRKQITGATLPANTVEADKFVPNKKILEESLQALVGLGYGKQASRDDVIEAMKAGAASSTEVLQAIFAKKNKEIHGDADTPPPPVQPSGTEPAVPDTPPAVEPMVTDKADTSPAVATIEPEARTKYNEIWDDEDSPYRSEDTATEVQAGPSEEDVDPYREEPPLPERSVRRREPTYKKGGLAGPATFKMPARPGPSSQWRGRGSLGTNLPWGDVPKIPENVLPPEEATRPVSAYMSPEPSLPEETRADRVSTEPTLPESGIAEDTNTGTEITKALDQVNDTLDDISDEVSQFLDKYSGGIADTLGHVAGDVVGGAAGGAVAAGGVEAAGVATAATGVEAAAGATAAGGAAAAGGILAPVAVGATGLAIGLAIGDGINKMLGQKTLTSTIKDSMAPEQNANTIAQSHGFKDFQDWHKANAGKAMAKELTQVSQQTTATPAVQPVIIQQPQAQPQQTPVVPVTTPGGVRPVDNTFLRYQEKRWTRTI